MLMTCVKLRSSLLHTFYGLPNIQEFVLDIILGCPSQDVRLALLHQLSDLSQEVEEGKENGAHMVLEVLVVAFC